MLKQAMRAFNESFAFPYRYRQILDRMTPHFDGDMHVLDVGTGDGHLASRLVESVGCRITGLDVCHQPKSYIEIHQYDGYEFPFDDESFDCVMMVDMLHHTSDIDRMMEEAKRVARRHVLVKDHFWTTRVDRTIMHIADYLGNIPYGVPLTYNFLQLNEWSALFKRHNLPELETLTFRYSALEPAQHILVKLDASVPADECSVVGSADTIMLEAGAAVIEVAAAPHPF